MTTTSVYISNSTLRVAVGNTGKNISLKKLCSLRMTGESFINGIVTNEQAFTDELVSIWKKYGLPCSNISLVLNSSQFISKTISVQSSYDGQT